MCILYVVDEFQYNIYFTGRHVPMYQSWCQWYRVLERTVVWSLCSHWFSTQQVSESATVGSTFRMHVMPDYTHGRNTLPPTHTHTYITMWQLYFTPMFHISILFIYKVSSYIFHITDIVIFFLTNISNNICVPIEYSQLMLVYKTIWSIAIIRTGTDMINNFQCWQQSCTIKPNRIYDLEVSCV